MTLSDILQHNARRMGKTHMLATILQQAKGTLVVRDQREAKRIKYEYGINAIPYDIDPSLTRFHTVQPRLEFGRENEMLPAADRHVYDLYNTNIIYVDPDAVSVWVKNLERENRILRGEIEHLKFEDRFQYVDVRYETQLRKLEAEIEKLKEYKTLFDNTEFVVKNG